MADLGGRRKKRVASRREQKAIRRNNDMRIRKDSQVIRLTVGKRGEEGEVLYLTPKTTVSRNRSVPKILLQKEKKKQAMAHVHKTKDGISSSAPPTLFWTLCKTT